MSRAPAVRARLRRAARAVAGMPRGARLALVGLVIAGAFIAVIVPLFTTGGVPQAEIAGQLPASVVAGHEVRVDIALDNVGDSIIYPVCVAMSGDGASLASADFQDVDAVTATRNRVCGGQLTGQETISITLVFTLSHRGSTSVSLVPQQGTTAIGPALVGTVSVS